MRINTLLSLVCALFVTCTESLRIPYFSRLHKMNLPCQPISKVGETNKAVLPKPLPRDEIPLYWRSSDDLPPWYLAEVLPKWLFEKGFGPPVWMVLDEIPRVTWTKGPQLWLLNMDRCNRSIHAYTCLRVNLVSSHAGHSLSGCYPKVISYTCSISCQRCLKCGEEGVRWNPSGKAGKGHTNFPRGKEYCITPKNVAEYKYLRAD